jgi:hypothetical protein
MKTILIILIGAAVTQIVLGQKIRQQPLKEIPSDCELTQVKLNTVNQLSAGKNIIIIGRLGSREVSDSLDKKRLAAVSQYLQKAWKKPPDSIILASGARTTGLGRLDFYVDGKMVDSIFVMKGHRIRTFCQYPD